MFNKLVEEALEKCKELELILYSNFEEDELLGKKTTYYHNLPTSYALMKKVIKDFPIVLKNQDWVSVKEMDIMKLCFDLIKSVETTIKYVTIRHNILSLKNMISGYEIIAELYNDKLMDCFLSLWAIGRDYKTIFNECWYLRRKHETNESFEDFFKVTDVWYEGYDEIDSNFNYDNELGVDMV